MPPSVRPLILYLGLGLWQVLQKFSCIDRFINIIEALHTGMQGNVAMSGSVSGDFALSNRVKQGCAFAKLEIAFSDIQKGVYIQTRKKADLSNIAHFRSLMISRLLRTDLLQLQNRLVSKLIKKTMSLSTSKVSKPRLSTHHCIYQQRAISTVQSFQISSQHYS